MKEEIKNLESLKNWIVAKSSEFKTKQLVLLDGPLGVGKTQTVKLLVDHFGESGEVANSPTFAFHNKYLLQNGQTIDHLDLYRIESEEELESIGFWDLFEQSSSWIFIEWPERVNSDFWPLHWSPISIKMAFGDSSEKRWVEFPKKP